MIVEILLAMAASAVLGVAVGRLLRAQNVLTWKLTGQPRRTGGPMRGGSRRDDPA